MKRKTEINGWERAERVLSMGAGKGHMALTEKDRAYICTCSARWQLESRIGEPTNRYRRIEHKPRRETWSA